MLRRRGRQTAVALLLGILAWAAGSGCGDDGLIIVSFRSGVVVGDVDCGAGGGSFNLFDQQGLTVLVIISDDTNIFLASGNFGTCNDISRRSAVEVRGPEDNGTIRAQTIQLGG